MASTEIARFEKGDKNRTARKADVMNEIVDFLNKVRNLKVSPPEAGNFIWADANGVLKLNGTGGGRIDVSDDDGHEVTDVETLEFVGYNATVVSDGGLDDAGKQVALVKVFPDPPESDTYVLASVDGNVDWISTEQCGCSGSGGGVDGGGAT